MRKIINNILYDTQTATLLYTNEETRRKLYKGVNGNYFMCYLNGKIVPYDVNLVKEYLGEYAVDVYLQEFPNVEEA